MPETDAVRIAKNILRGENIQPEETLKLVNELQKEKAFDYGRKIAAIVRMNFGLKLEPETALKLAQKQALCTYKDQNLSGEKKFEEALFILDEGHRLLCETLSTTKNQESLGLAGAIYKYRWEISGQKGHLELSLNYYLRGYSEGIQIDFGYNAVNAAFVFDLLAFLECKGIEKSHPCFSDTVRRQMQAKQIREEIINQLIPLKEKPEMQWLNQQWWFFVTIAEAYFGLSMYIEAEEWFGKAKKLPDVPDWEKESTTRQLAALARLQLGDNIWEQNFKESFPGRVLTSLAGEQAVRSMLLGKVGLALSGGGFRASLFHIGVLARFAELDLLRHVEVLSCVSGGSIIGAFYYLKLRNLLKTKKDENIERDDYIKIVHEISEEFLKGVQRNLRVRVAKELIKNLRMIIGNYSRTVRIGELYEEELFKLIIDGEENNHRFISNLVIKPEGNEDFSPKLHNWHREAKVPILILNATALNTGHNWQFTASWMGEPTSSIDPEIDANYRFRRMYYHEAPPDHRKIRLGQAVAASSCVPGLFEPLNQKKLYPRDEPPRMTVRLIDGGVHDNQGISGLLEQGCGLILVSDASGQMEAEDNPSGGIIGVTSRSNSILMARVREAEYRELDARRRSGALRGFMFVHLKKDLDVEPISWATCDEPLEESEKLRSLKGESPLTFYGVRKDIQRSLAALRTDLDSFSDAEAYALMLSGYKMTEHEFPRAVEKTPCSASCTPNWPFLPLEGAMKRSTGHEAEHEELKHLLDVGSSRMFKIWQLSKPLRITGVTIAILVLSGVIWALIKWWDVRIIKASTLGMLLLGLGLTAFFGKTFAGIVQYRESLAKIIIGIGMSLAGWLLARLHLNIFDKWFLKYGTIDALKGRAKKRGVAGVRD